MTKKTLSKLLEYYGRKNNLYIKVPYIFICILYLFFSLMSKSLLPSCQWSRTQYLVAALWLRTTVLECQVLFSERQRERKLTRNDRSTLMDPADPFDWLTVFCGPDTFFLALIPFPQKGSFKVISHFTNGFFPSVCHITPLNCTNYSFHAKFRSNPSIHWEHLLNKSNFWKRALFALSVHLEVINNQGDCCSSEGVMKSAIPQLWKQ